MTRQGNPNLEMCVSYIDELWQEHPRLSDASSVQNHNCVRRKKAGREVDHPLQKLGEHNRLVHQELLVSLHSNDGREAGRVHARNIHVRPTGYF